jgi:hypothetical protein
MTGAPGVRDSRAAAGGGALAEARPSPPPRTDPLAAALAFAVREAVRLEAERSALNPAPGRANVVSMTKPEAHAA